MSDQLGDLRDDGISEGVKRVHVMGKPINDSEKLGSNFVVVVGFSLMARAIQCPRPYEPPPFFLAPLPLLPSHARGVGNNPEPIALVREANGASRNAVPLRIIPERGQVSENVSKPPPKQSCDVFHKHVSGSYLANEPGVFAPQAGSFSSEAGAFSGDADVLAGEAAAYDIGPRPGFGQPIGVERANVVMDRNLWPMLRQHPPAEWIDLAERHGLETARPLQAEGKAADAAEQVEDFQHPRLPAKNADRANPASSFGEETLSRLPDSTDPGLPAGTVRRRTTPPPVSPGPKPPFATRRPKPGHVRFMVHPGEWETRRAARERITADPPAALQADVGVQAHPRPSRVRV